MSCPCKPRWARRKEARPQELLAAALDLFVECGFAATRLDDVARQAGVSKGTLYLYYSSKEELFKAVVRESILPTLDQAEGMLDQFDGDSQTLLRMMMLNWWQNVGSTQISGLAKLMIAEAGNFPELAEFYQSEVVDRGERLVAAMLRRGVARGEIRPLNMDVAPRILMAPMIMMMVWKHSTGVCRIAPEMLPRYVEQVIDMALRGVLILDADGLPPGSAAPG